MKTDRVTERKLDALSILADRDAANAAHGGMTPSQFAHHFWPDRTFARGNGPWGLGPDASGRLGGRMLTALARMGLASITHHDCYWTAQITDEGRAALRAAARVRKEQER